MNLLDCLPESCKFAVDKFWEGIEEIRLRGDSPMKVRYKGAWYFAEGSALVKNQTKNAASVTADEIGKVLQAACANSVYAYEKQLAEGYFSLDDGTRIGCAGTVNINGDRAYFKQYSSLCVRVAHAAPKCSAQISRKTGQDANILVIGRPGAGKTTFLRDMAAEAVGKYNVTVVDERGELSNLKDFEKYRRQCDVLLYADKKYAFEVATRCLCPDVIVCDELIEKDFLQVKSVIESGVKIYASIHGNDVQSIRSKIANYGISFDFCVLLDGENRNNPRLYGKTGNEIIL